MLNALLIVRDEKQPEEFFARLERSCKARIVRFDLAWPLFLPKNGRNEEGKIDIPAGNPRTQWFSLIHWMRQTLGEEVDMLGNEQANVIGYLPACTPAALEYVSRTFSMYTPSLGVFHAAEGSFQMEEVIILAERYVKGEAVEIIVDAWMPPTVNVLAPPTPLMQKMSRTKGEGEFTWLTGLLGSDRLFSQVYRLKPHACGNRLHSHSGVDEMFYVLEGSGTLILTQGEYPLKKGNVITKPAGSGMATQFIAGDEGLTILDIEVWADYDQTDAVFYPAHTEVMLRGRGLQHGAASHTYFPSDDIMNHYTENYKRQRDGSRK